ncbi:M23 family metallopeptidase [Leptospira sp. 96542]|nr:M23 family metallopeptidase [Leptospira sp. 96542]
MFRFCGQFFGVTYVTIILVIFFNSIELKAERGVREECSHPYICLIEIEDGDSLELKVKNKSEVPDTANSIRLGAVLKNLSSDVSFPVYTVIRGAEVKTLLKLKVQDPKKDSFRNFSFNVHPGDWDAIHDDSVTYLLPFAMGQKVKVVQGYNGKITHKDSIMYALDFDMPIGTPVHAARKGYIREIESKYNEGGFKPHLFSKANFIIIQHDDGTFGNYAHLKQGGVVVKVGDFVDAGQLIGFSGNTGYSEGPHLHFEVNRADKNSNSISIPTQFKTQYAESEPLKEMYTYWHPTAGEVLPDSPILSEGIFLCKTVKEINSNTCGMNDFKQGETVNLLLDFIKPGKHNISVEFSKLDVDSPQPIQLSWQSKPDSAYERCYLPLRKNANMVGKWKVRVFVNGEEKKSVFFEVFS